MFSRNSEANPLEFEEKLKKMCQHLKHIFLSVFLEIWKWMMFQEFLEIGDCYFI